MVRTLAFPSRSEAYLEDLILAHRAFWAVLIAALPAALILCFFLAGVELETPRTESSSSVSLLIFSCSLTARRNWTALRLDNALLICGNTSRPLNKGRFLRPEHSDGSVLSIPA